MNYIAYGRGQKSTSGLSREQMPRKTKIGTEVANVTRDSDYHFQGQKVKGQSHQAALLSAALTRKAAAEVSVGTYSAWESTATLRLLGGARQRRRGAGELCLATRTACYISRVLACTYTILSVMQNG